MNPGRVITWFRGYELWWQASTAQEILNTGIGAQWAVHLMKLTASELGSLPVRRSMGGLPDAGD